MPDTIATGVQPVLPAYLEKLRSELPPYVGYPKASEIRQQSKATLKRRIKAGELVALRDGNRVLIETLSLLHDLAKLPFANAEPASTRNLVRIEPGTKLGKRKHKRQPAAVAANP